MKWHNFVFYIVVISLTLICGNAFAADNGGMFSSLVASGKQIFEDLRELIYIVAGFGIIAVGIGGIFGNLNWKWLGAILISLVIIATAGEILSLLTNKVSGGDDGYNKVNIRSSNAAGITNTIQSGS